MGMVRVYEFNEDNSRGEAWTAEKGGYNKWMTVLVEKQKSETRTHGFHHVGGYDDEINATEEA